MIVVVSNREVNPKANNHKVFGDKPNKKGLDELRVAKAKYDENKNKWKVDLLPEKAAKIKAGVPPSLILFNQILKGIGNGELSGDWVLFVHGFNQSFLDNLEKCRKIEKLYGVNVLAFSWPSNQGGFKPKEYKKARAAARGCTNAFDRVLEKLSSYLTSRPFTKTCDINISLMAYSMGNFVVENYVRDPVFCDETKIFSNVILTQADVDVESHTEWVEMVEHCKRVYVTINENDSVLKWSDVVNPPRLGNTVKYLDGNHVVYFDFTDGESVGSTHGIFYKTAVTNKVVHDIFKRALIGKHAELATGISFNAKKNAFELDE